MKPKKPRGMIYAQQIWAQIPLTIKLLQLQRKPTGRQEESIIYHQHRRGINATIILLSAVCVEGFLVQCLMTFTIKNPAPDSFESRLDSEFQRRVADAQHGKLDELFNIALGSTLGNLISDKKLVDSIDALFKFRNGIGHGRSIIFDVYEKDGPISGMDFETRKQYKFVHDYLKSKKLLKSEYDLLSNETADHFVEAIKHYMLKVTKFIPQYNADIRNYIQESFTDKIKIPY